MQPRSRRQCHQFIMHLAMKIIGLMGGNDNNADGSISLPRKSGELILSQDGTAAASSASAAVKTTTDTVTMVSASAATAGAR